MYVYTREYSCCQHVQLLYCPKNDRHCRETRKIKFLKCMHQLAVANQEAKSWCRCLWEQVAAYWYDAKITVTSSSESQKEYPECLLFNWLWSLVINRPNHGPCVDIEQWAAGSQELVSNLSSASPPLFGFCWTVIEDSLDQRTFGVWRKSACWQRSLAHPLAAQLWQLSSSRRQEPCPSPANFQVQRAHRFETSPETLTRNKRRVRCVRRHIHTYNCIFMHIHMLHTYTYIYTNILAYTVFFYLGVFQPISLLYIHIHTYIYTYICILLYTYI